MLKRIYPVILTCLLVSGPAFADQLTLKNGDRLTGKIVKSDGKQVVIKTEFAGEVTVVWDAVTNITSDAPLYLMLADGRIVSGLVSTTGDQIEVRAPGAAAVATTKSAITGLRSEDEQKAVERLQHPGLFELWTGSATLGLALTRGNSDTTNFALGFAASRTTARDKIGVYAASIYERDSTDGVSRTTSNAIRGGVRYDHDLTKRLFGFLFTSLERNELQDLDLRLVLGGGLGYHAIRNERTELDLFGGASFNREWFHVADDRSSGEALAGQSLAYKLGSHTSLHEQFVVFPNLTDPGEYRMNFDTTMSTDITRRIGWQLTLSDRFLSNPPPGFERNDLLMTTGLTVRIGH
jgi:putative salt-induced outer membrane protein YdiY